MPSTHLSETVLSNLEYSSFYRSFIPTLREHGGNKEATGLCPFHDDHNPSFSVNVETGLWKCFAGCGQGDVIAFYKKLNGVDFKIALKDLATIAGMTESTRGEIATYDYTDEHGALLYQIVRYEPKDFRPRRKNSDGSWTYDLRGVRRVPYNLHELVTASEAIVVEGEKDADNLDALALGFAEGTAITTTAGGAKGWRPEYSDYFIGKQVVIIPDNDQPGLTYAKTIARSVLDKASSIKIIDLPGLGERRETHGLDVTDWIENKRKQGRTDHEIQAELYEIISKTPAWEPEPDINQEHIPGLVRLDTVKLEPVYWLWQDRIPLGKLTVIDGDPGLGKSTVTLDLAARVSRGATMPDGSPGISGGAVLMTLEDGLADTIVPRLNAAGADLSRIVALQSVQDEKGNLRYPTVKDIDAIRQACKKVQAKIVIIDPIMAHLDGQVNSWRDQDIRAALTPLCKLAEELNLAVVVVRHLNKASGGQAIYRGSGSIGITGQARCTLLVARDPENESRRIFATIKNNLAPEAPSLSFSLEGVGSASRIIWGGVSNHKADALLAIPTAPEERSALDEAKDFLKDFLSNSPVDAKVVQREAKSAGIKEATLRRAKEALNIRVEKQSFRGGWAWVLPEDAQEVPKVLINNNEHLREEMSTFEQTDEPITVLGVLE
jgi:5S rRNA maturation endonuclease (ribonuclease M5)